MPVITIALAGAFALLVIIVMVVASRVRVAGPNEAFIITGRKTKAVRDPSTGAVTTDMSGQKVVMGASVFVIPLVQRLHVMDLSSRRISVGIGGAVSAQGIKCDLEGVAIVKVGGNEDAIRAAAQRFLSQQEGIEVFTQEVLAGSLRAIVGRLTVEEIIKDRAAFASAVAEEAENSLTNQGLVLDTFQLQDIRAEGNYLHDLGRPEAARVAMEAAIAEAKALQSSEEERFLAEESIAVANRQLSLRQAEIQAEIDAAGATAAAAGPLKRAERDQEVLTLQEKVAERTAALKARELDTEIRKPADAQRYRVEQEAEATKSAALRRAEADKASTIAAAEAAAARAEIEGAAERTRRAALAEAEEIEGRLRGQAERERREAVAQAVQREGEAEAAAILAKGQAEADAMDRRAEAFEAYGEAAVLDLLLKVLPDVVRAASEPMSAIDKMTVISTDGASQVTRTVAGNVEQGIQVASDLSGVDLRQMLGLLAAKAGSVPVPVTAGSGGGVAGDGSAGPAPAEEGAAA